jgi:hypothetical protein
MELLGTSGKVFSSMVSLDYLFFMHFNKGNTPGPTAAKAQAMYDNLQKTAELNAFRKRRKVLFNNKIYS